MRLRFAVAVPVLIGSLLPLACSGRHSPRMSTTATPPSPPAATAASSAPLATSRATVATPAGTAPTPASATTVPRQPPANASLSLTATLSVSLAGTNGSYTYSYRADGAVISLERDGTFDTTAPIDATLTLNATGCTLNLRLVNPQLEVAGSISDDGTLRIASLRVRQDGVAGADPCPNAGGAAAPDFSSIGAGTTNLSPAAPAAIRFSDGASASLPQPTALDRYPRSATAVWSGTIRLVVPGDCAVQVEVRCPCLPPCDTPIASR
jgi:hypothetical protein